MSMLFVHFKNLHFSKWTNIPRKRDIFYYKRLRTPLSPLALSLRQKITQIDSFVQFFIKEKEIFCKKWRIASNSILKDVKY